MNIEHFLNLKETSWMDTDSHESDIVMSTRIRLARNILNYRFPTMFSLEEAEQHIWKELEKIKSEKVEESELQKVKNKVESTMLFAELSILDKAMNLAFFEMLSQAEDYNQEVAKYAAVTADDVQRVAKELFSRENSSTLFYKSKEKENAE